MCCDTQRRVLLLPEDRRHPSTSFVPLWAQWPDPGTEQPLLHLHHPSKTCSSVSKVPGRPSSFPLLLSHPRPFPLAPAWPLLDLSAGSSLPHEYRQGRACRGLDANRRQRISSSTSSHSLYTGTGTFTSMIEDAKDEQMCIHTLMSRPAFVCVCVWRVCFDDVPRLKEKRWFFRLMHLVILKIHQNKGLNHVQKAKKKH